MGLTIILESSGLVSGVVRSGVASFLCMFIASGSRNLVDSHFVLYCLAFLHPAFAQILFRITDSIAILPLARRYLLLFHCFLDSQLQTRRETWVPLFVEVCLSAHLFGGMAADVAGVVSCRSADGSGYYHICLKRRMLVLEEKNCCHATAGDLR